MAATPVPASGTMAVSGSYPTAGSIINGKYQVENVIGEGGVGIVVSARNIELGDLVALKFLRAEMLARPDVVGRFMFEAKAACSIKSDHSATVFDVGRTPEGIPFLVMEFLEGHDLASVIANGPLDVRDVAEYAMHTCEALAAAHAKGIVHRDIKPENLFIEIRSGMKSIKVLDFGISKVALTGKVLSSSVPLVQTQNLMGTPLYMSPEQVRSPERVDARTDLYSLGVVMYEALTGALPIAAESITELCAAILEQPITPITQYRRDLPEALVLVIEKCLAKEQRDRFQNAAEVAIALMPFAPKRARICAERAGEALVAAGLVSPESVRFASTIPNSLPSGGYPAFQIPPQSGISASFIPSNGAVALPSSPPAREMRKDRKMVYVAVAALLVGLAGASFAIVTRGAHSPARVDAKTGMTEAPPPATLDPLPLSTEAKAAEATTAEAKAAEATTADAKVAPTAETSAADAPTSMQGAPKHPKKPKAATAGTPAVPAASNEKKQPDALDIGY